MYKELFFIARPILTPEFITQEVSFQEAFVFFQSIAYVIVDGFGSILTINVQIAVGHVKSKLYLKYFLC